MNLSIGGESCHQEKSYSPIKATSVMSDARRADSSARIRSMSANRSLPIGEARPRPWCPRARATVVTRRRVDNARHRLERLYQLRARFLSRAVVLGRAGGNSSLPYAAQEGCAARQGSLVLRGREQAH